MIREIFQIKFGKAKPALTSIRSAKAFMKRVGRASDRILTDFTGQFHNLVMKSKFKSLAAYEKAIRSHLGSQERRKWYDSFVSLVESGRSEIFNIVN